MPVYSEDLKRHVIPRWRPLHESLRRLELSPLVLAKRDKRPPDEDFAERLEEWRRHRTFHFAADVVAAALSVGREDEAKEAARYILLNPRPDRKAAESIAQRVLGLLAAEVPNQAVRTTRTATVHRLRTRLQRQPRNALLWIDLAFHHTVLGLRFKAERAVLTALQLAPDNRFVLRAASRFYLHIGHDTTGHDVLRLSPAVSHDPWVLASELAAAAAANRTSRFTGTAKRMLSAGDFSPHELSELASALGSLELESGHTRPARRLFQASLNDASENAIAQAAWVVRRGKVTLDATRTHPSVPSHEALAWQRYYLSDWRQAEAEGEEWHDDQPFSSRPAIFRTYLLATVMGKYGASLQVAKQGLMANPENFTLLNNAAFAAARSRRTDEAARIFRRIRPCVLGTRDTIVWLATNGLLEFRGGNANRGRDLYREAIEKARILGSNRLLALARLNFAFEAYEAGCPDAEQVRLEALQATQELQDPDIVPLRQRLQSLRLQGQQR